VTPKRKRKWSTLLSLSVLLASVAAAVLLVATRPEPKRQQPGPRGALVRVKTVQEKLHRLDVRGSGSVIPARAVRIRPQVSGRMATLHPQLIPGGVVERGDVLVEIEPADFDIALQQAESRLKRAEAQLRLEEGRQVVAEREWDLYRGEASMVQTNSTLALREPQQRTAEADVQAAAADVQQAELNLSRTEVTAPFNAVVLEESAEVGQLASAESELARLAGTDTFWVQVSIPPDRVPDVQVRSAHRAGAVAHISYDAGAYRVERKGEVIRLLTELDPAGGMARLLVVVPDPLGLKTAEQGATRSQGLLIGSYVEVRIEGKREEQLVEVPREAVHDGDRVYVFSEDGTLAIRTVEIAGRLPQSLLVRSGLEHGEAVVVSPLATPVDGMRLRRASRDDVAIRSAPTS